MIACCAIGALQGAAPGQANLVSQWLVYNATLKGIPHVRKDNGYNANCEGWSWQQAGFMDANGQYLPIDPITGDIMNGNVVVGKLVSSGIYINTTTNVGVADLSGGATLQGVYDAMLPFNNKAVGRLHISTHGAFRKVDDEATTGGLLVLDNNRVYAGFRRAGVVTDRGTGVMGFPAYTITAKAQTVGADGGGRFNVELYNCNSGQDPDAGGPEFSVAATATVPFGRVGSAPNIVNRVVGVTSSVPIVRCTVTITPQIPANVNRTQFDQAVTKYMKANPDLFNRCTTPAAWIMGLPSGDHFPLLNQRLNAITLANKTVVNPTWALQYNQTSALAPGAGDVATDNPTTWASADGDSIVKYNADDGGLSSSFLIHSVTGIDADPSVLHVCAAADVDASPPDSGLQLATSVMRLSPYGGGFDEIAGNATLQYADDVDPASLQLYELVGSQWVQFSSPLTLSIDPIARTVSSDFLFAGAFDEADGVVVAGFANVPEPGLLAPALLIFAGAARKTSARLN
jgi:hypothetical protein